MEQRPIAVVCLTGHRDIPTDHALRLPSLIEAQLRALIARGAREIRAGGALGFDMVATLKVIELKEEFPFLHLALYLPCRDQADRWSAAGQRAYRYILSRADSICYESDAYTKTCMLDRNRRLVQGSQVCLAYCTHGRSGSSYTYAYAQRQGLEVINLAHLLAEK